MTGGPDNEPDVEVLRVDRYLESILIARDRGAAAAPYDSRLDPDLRSVAERLSAELVRVHPSFRFEERLANRLSDLAAAIRTPLAAGAEPGPPRALAVAGYGNPEDSALVDPAGPGPAGSQPAALEEALGGRNRPYLIGGALTSAAISLAGAAFVAWRLTRPFHRRPGHGTGLA